MLDLRLTNATFLTMDDAHPVAAQLGIWQGRIVGVDDEVAGLPAREEVDLDGAVVLPGFIDAHVHLFWAGLAALSPSLAPATSVDEALELIAAAAGRVPVGEWLDVVGYDQRRLGRHLTAGELDAVSAGRKLFVIHDSGHACAVNTSVLNLLPPTVPHQDGVLTESGMAAVRDLRMPYEVGDLVEALELAGRQCRAQGVTAVAEAGIGGGLVRHSPVELAAFQDALAADALPIRVRAMVAADALRPVTLNNDGDGGWALDLGLRTGLGDDRLAIGALKVFTDGGMMARTAALTAPYLGPEGPEGQEDPEGSEGSGELYADLDELRRQIIEGHRAGWQLAVHAIGDRAVDVALDALQTAQDEWKRPDARHRIEHAGLVRPDQLPRFAELDVTAVIQPGFLRWFGDDYAAIMGPERAPWLYRGRSFLDAGVRLVASSDRPVTSGAPLEAIQFMVERTSRSGQLIGPDETITVDAALRAHTIDAAHACGWEQSIGSLAPGKLADLVVLAADPREVPVEEIAKIEVLATYLSGKQD
jgi:predicted amidohydrolase YtcJ